MASHSWLDELRWRGMLHQHTEGLSEALARGTLSAYAGFDPTASSLHVGNLVPVMGLVHLQRHGHRPVFLAGGGTGMIGDPSGKSTERALMTVDETRENTRHIRAQLERFVDTSGKTGAILRDNADWLTPLKAIEFMRDVGKHFTVNYMTQKESVKSRLDGGLSYTEFSYMLLQAYDYLQLFKRDGVTLQVGGSDQWGNITAGIELIRRTESAVAHAATFPLITTATGTKFGKTEAGAVWLDPQRTSPYRFYQFWINTDDRDVVPYLKFFTWLTREEIAELEEKVRTAPQEREAQKRLAREVTRMVHGEDALAKAERATAVLFGAEVSALEPREVSDIFADVPSTEIPKSRIQEGLSLVDLLVAAGLTPSKGEARRAIQGGGIYLNNVRVADEKKAVTIDDTIGGELIVLRKGRKEYRLVRVG
jgi:tyrosyl-tRNA synthetase